MKKSEIQKVMREVAIFEEFIGSMDEEFFEELPFMADDLTGPCDDDVEVDCPYVNMLPDESNTEDGSPLRF